MTPDDVDEGKDDKANDDNVRPDIDDAGIDVESEALDKFLGLHMKVQGNDNASTVLGKVTKRKRDHDGALIGRSNPNPILNTAVYQVETPDGNIHEYTANIIAKKLWDQVNDDGWDYGLLHEIIGHRKTKNAVPLSEEFIETSGGARRRVITNKGWDFQVRWETGETSWIPLKDIKESNAAKVVEYAIQEGIEKEPAFTWWMKTALKQRDAMINEVCVRL